MFPHRNKRKKYKSTYGKRITLVLFLYCLYIVLCESLVCITFAVPRSLMHTTLIVTFSIACALFVCGSLIMLFYIVPCLKKKQAKEDFEKSDFSPYTSLGESEVFEHEYLVCRYTFTTDPFDIDESVILSDEKSFSDYFNQFYRERIISEEQIENSTDSSPFFVGSYSGENGIKTRVDKKLSGDKVTVEIYELHCAEFSAEGIRIGEKLYGYNETQAEVFARFHQSTDFTVCIRLIILLADDTVLSFKLSSKIAAVVNRFQIPLKNRELFDYILKDPKKAYEQTAKQLILRKLK